MDLGEFTTDRRNDPRSTNQLIEIALKATPDDEESDESKQGWDAIWVLRYRATREVLETSRKLCLSDEPNRRSVGADILGQLGIPDRTFPNECLQILLGLLDDPNLDVLDSACVALGHIHQPEAIEPLSKLKNHPDADIRYAVTFGLLNYEDDRAIQTLIELSQDEDDKVRDWATFGLGAMIDTDTPEIRQALFQRLDDSFGNVIGEAMVGLARRKDERVLEPLLRDLARDDAGSLVLDAAEEFADPRLVPALMDLKQRWITAGELKDAESLDSVIAACTPQSKTE